MSNPKNLTEAARLLGLNRRRFYDWEGYGLVNLGERGGRGAPVSMQMFNRLCTIKVLRDAGLSITAIKRILTALDYGDEESAIEMLNKHSEIADRRADILAHITSAIAVGTNVMDAICANGGNDDETDQ